MKKPVDRPLSVLIAQIMLVLMLINAIALTAMLSSFCFLDAPAPSCLSLRMINAFVLHFLLLAGIFLAFWGLQKRKRYGKWLAVVWLISGTVAAIANSYRVQLIYRALIEWKPLPTPPYECWDKQPGSIIISSCGYESYQELMLRLVADVLPALIPGLLALRLLYSPAAKRFFSQANSR